MTIAARTARVLRRARLGHHAMSTVRALPTFELVPSPADVPQDLNGKCKMYENQPGLPKMPVPELADSCSSFLKALEPLTYAGEEVIDEATKAVALFLEPGGEGQALQEELLRRDSESEGTSYIAPFWNDMYMRGRWPVSVHSNPGGKCTTRQFEAVGAETQLERTAVWIRASLAFLRRANDGSLEPDVFRRTPLDMRAYCKMYGSTRIPLAEKDEHVQVANFGGVDCGYGGVRHVVVMIDGCVYAVDVISPDGRELEAGAIHRQLERAVKLHESRPQEGRGNLEERVGMLTTLDRDRWAAARKALETDEVSARALNGIDSALFAVFLDSRAEVEEQARACDGDLRAAMVRNGLAGCGENARNRWHDKSVNITVDDQGMPYYSFEHSWGDGISVLRWGLDAGVEIEEGTFSLLDQPVGESERDLGVVALPFSLDDETKTLVEVADREFSELNESLSLATLTYTTWGAADTKAAGYSPDGAAQQCLQLAYALCNAHPGETVATYESASTQAFRGGRTETIRSATAESADFVKFALHAIVKTGEEKEARTLQEKEELRQKFKAACEQHAAVAGAAASGKGFDRHLYALKVIAEEEEKPTPALFASRGYQLLANNVLSTSTVSNPYTDQTSFGPVVTHGYGVMYHIDPSELRFCVTSYPGSAVPEGAWGKPSGTAREFIKALERAMDFCAEEFFFETQ